MIEVLRLSVANFRAFIALHEAGAPQADEGEGWPQRLQGLQSIVARIETALSHYELELRKGSPFVP